MQATKESFAMRRITEGVVWYDTIPPPPPPAHVLRLEALLDTLYAEDLGPDRIRPNLTGEIVDHDLVVRLDADRHTKTIVEFLLFAHIYKYARRVGLVVEEVVHVITEENHRDGVQSYNVIVVPDDWSLVHGPEVWLGLVRPWIDELYELAVTDYNAPSFDALQAALGPHVWLTVDDYHARVDGYLSGLIERAHSAAGIFDDPASLNPRVMPFKGFASLDVVSPDVAVEFIFTDRDDNTIEERAYRQVLLEDLDAIGVVPRKHTIRVRRPGERIDLHTIYVVPMYYIPREGGPSKLMLGSALHPKRDAVAARIAAMQASPLGLGRR